VRCERAERALEPHGDLPGRLVGEGERADALGAEAESFDEESNPLGQAERLAGARTGEDEERARGCLDRLALKGGGMVRQNPRDWQVGVRGRFDLEGEDAHEVVTNVQWKPTVRQAELA
jgi:hypothetical protein